MDCHAGGLKPTHAYHLAVYTKMICGSNVHIHLYSIYVEYLHFTVNTVWQNVEFKLCLLFLLFKLSIPSTVCQ